MAKFLNTSDIIFPIEILIKQAFNYLLLLSVLGLTSCSTNTIQQPAVARNPTPPHTLIEVQRRAKAVEILNKNVQNKMTPEQVTQCKKLGGEVTVMGLAQFDMCVINYPDAGKTCQDSSDCMGGCVGEDTTPVDIPNQQGVCHSRNVFFGCHAWIEKGVTQGTMCVD